VYVGCMLYIKINTIFYNVYLFYLYFKQQREEKAKKIDRRKEE